MRSLKLHVGRALEAAGFRAIPLAKFPVITVNLLEVGFLLLPNRTDIVLVQVGAYDGIHADPAKRLIRASVPHLRAVLIEPQPEPCMILREKYCFYDNIVIFEGALMPQNGVIPLYVPGDPSLATCASFDEQFIMRRARNYHTVDVEALDWPTLTRRFSLDHVDLLQIDAEGMDKVLIQHVLQTADAIKPTVIHFEVGNLSGSERSVLRELLSECAYGLIEGQHDAVAIHASLIERPFS